MRLPYAEYRRLDLPRPERPFSGLDGWLHLIDGWRHGGRVARELAARAAAVDARCDALRELEAVELGERLSRCAEQARLGRLGPAEEWFAEVVEAARRSLGLRAHREQIMGALGVAQGHLIEMETGSGKSLTAALAAVAMGWGGRPCHILTVNDYLAARDAEFFAPFYQRCGLSVAVVTEEMQGDARRDGYAKAITYTTSKQLLADFLRDRLLAGEAHSGARATVRRGLGLHARGEAPVLRGIDQVIVDEADSLLIDEAISPLQIQAAAENRLLDSAVGEAVRLAGLLDEGADYRVEPEPRRVRLTSAGKKRLEAWGAELPPLWRGRDRREALVVQALAARHLFHRDEHYVVRDGKVVIVDEFTGRLMPQRNWGQGLHQAVEAKEGLELSAAHDVHARMSFQHFFRLFRRLGGMTGTAREARAELWRVYRLLVVPIPSHWPSRRVALPTQRCRTLAEKWSAIADEVRERQRHGQPVLVGTRSVADSQALAAQLEATGLSVALLNAHRHEEEASIIADAGQRGRITIATNMAGRGTDIALGPGVAELGGLHVILSEPHESGRVDRQLIGRAARQGDPGSHRRYLSLEDPLLRRFLPASLRSASARWLDSLVWIAQRRAQWAAARARHQVLERDRKQAEQLLFARRGGG